ncbi:hypothetical protein KJ853_02125 [Patescibacteria group bacterium]|nr:hypothetical protein [Patescibacteria group bacterium]
MSKITLKIKNSAGHSLRQTENALNLATRKTAGAPKKQRRFYAWFLLLLILLEAGIIIYAFFSRPALPYKNLIPDNAAATIYLNQPSLANLTKSLKDAQFVWPAFDDAQKSFSAFYSRAGLNLNELLMAFENQIVLVLLPETEGSLPRWLALATAKTGQAGLETKIRNAQNALKQNFNLSSEVYRQIEITKIKPLEQNRATLYFAQVKNSFFLTNNLDLLQDTIDKAIK